MWVFSLSRLLAEPMIAFVLEVVLVDDVESFGESLVDLGGLKVVTRFFPLNIIRISQKKYSKTI